MYGALDISTSGMIAQRARLTVISSNIANAHTMLDENGTMSPYRRRMVHFAPGDPASRSGNDSLGVHVAEIEIDSAPFNTRYDPNNPYADEQGYVKMPNINPVIEQINAMEAARAYEANIVAAEATKTMMGQALRLIA